MHFELQFRVDRRRVVAAVHERVDFRIAHEHGRLAPDDAGVEVPLHAIAVDEGDAVVLLEADWKMAGRIEVVLAGDAVKEDRTPQTAPQLDRIPGIRRQAEIDTPPFHGAAGMNPRSDARLEGGGREVRRTFGAEPDVDPRIALQALEHRREDREVHRRPRVDEHAAAATDSCEQRVDVVDLCAEPAHIFAVRGVAAARLSGVHRLSA